MRYVPVKGRKLLSNYFIFCDCILEIGNSVFQRNFHALPIVLDFFYTMYSNLRPFFGSISFEYNEGNL